MKRKVFFIAVLAMILLAAIGQKNEKAPKEKKARHAASHGDYNVARASELKDDIFRFIALIEGGARADGCAYFDQDSRTRTYKGHPKARKVAGGRWTTWYGVTVTPNGTLLKPYQKVSKATAKKWCFYHLDRHVVPFFKHFTKKMSDEEIIGTALFIYNVGGEAVTGFNRHGKKIGSPSRFLLAFNDGKKSDYVVNCMTRYRKSGGRRANGLLKRHWVQGAAYKGILTADNIMDLRPEHFYKTKNLGNYYWLSKPNVLKESKDKLYLLRYDDTTIPLFFAWNEAKRGQTSVKLII